MKVRRFDSSEGNVFKYVFDFGDAVAESVMYRYGSFMERTVLCVSVQSGCPVGCKFCGTGKQFIRNLTAGEIWDQFYHCINDQNIEEKLYDIKKFQVMFMSMGEPFLNIDSVIESMDLITEECETTQLLVSTMGVNNIDAWKKFTRYSVRNRNVGLQLSVHEAIDSKRNDLIPFKNKFDLRNLRDMGLLWNAATGRDVYINYCIGESNQSETEMNRLKDLFSSFFFRMTFSVICSDDENMKEKGYKNLERINEISQSFLEDGYNVRVFDPAGQDDIGGGCGQLWFVQEWMKNKNNKR